MDSIIYDVLATLVTLLLCAYALLAATQLVRSRLPELDLRASVAAAAAVRLIAIVALPLTGIEETLRGGDEAGFVAESTEIAGTTFGSTPWLDALTGELYEFIFAVQIGLWSSPEVALRMTQATIAILGLVCIAVAVYVLVGARAARIAMWIMALEPTGIFFSTYLHKEPTMILASGLVALGGAMIWRHARMRWIAVLALGCLIAVATRPYAGWFLIAASAGIMLHAGLRSGARGNVGSGLTLVSGVILLAAIALPTVLEASTDESLEANLQGSQDANAADEDANLGLERVDFSTRGAIVRNLPNRMFDVLTQPYPWQTENISQVLGALGALLTLVVLFYFIRTIWQRRGAVFEAAGPLLYVGFSLLVAYSLSAGNAGTAFRYRTHVLILLIAAIVALRFGDSERVTARLPKSLRNANRRAAPESA